MSADGQSPQEYVGSAGQMTNICPSLPRHTCFVGLLSLLFSVHYQGCSFSVCRSCIHSLTSRTLVFSGVARKGASHLIAIRPVNLRRYFSTPVRYVPVAKVKPQIGMASSDHKGFRENLHATRGSILPKKLAVSNLRFYLCHRNETNGYRNTQKKNEGFTEYGFDSVGTHFTAPESAKNKS